jgi:hypothetical protein|tara:strand:- start:201 stop:563 length:363 start_codon:yes stop_codon:yes gene_type:complete
MKKLLDLLNEIEEKQASKPVNESPEVVNELGKFFVVKKPKKGMTKEDIMLELTVFDEIKMDEVKGVYKHKSDASRVATEALKEYEGQIKEMESAMEEYRLAKKDIDEKKKAAKERIKSLQ